MKTKTYFLTILIIVLSFNINAQIKVKPVGKVIVGTERTSDDADNVLTMHLLGKGGTYGYGSKLAFGDFGRYNYYGWNAFVGEYGNYDSDRLWLHGKNGIYLTYSRGDNIIGYYNVSSGNKFTFNCDVYANGVKLTSDERFKTGINKLNNSLNLLKKLNGVSYYYNFSKTLNKAKSMAIDNNSELNDDMLPPTEKELADKAKFELLEKGSLSASSKKRRLGFIAQDLQKVFPELVDQDSAGYFYVDYIGLIPVMIEGLKEQQTIIDAQSIKIKELEQKVIKMADSENTSNNPKNPNLSLNPSGSGKTTNAFLYQNTPNPFSHTTEIKYYIPEESKSAVLYIFNLQGSLLKSEKIVGLGEGNIIINGSELQPGMYVYSLLIDGHEVDTKRMILTQ